MRVFSPNAALACGLLLAGAASAQQAPETGRPPKVETTSEANRKNLQGVATAPLRDLNMIRTKIPPVLLDAAADPYKRPGGRRCADLVALLAPLDDALGPDLDRLPADDDGVLEKGRNTAFGVMAGAASSALPFRSGLRHLSGAERHDQTVQAVIVAGSVRRAYLKGLGEARGCSPPATPSHQRSKTTTATAAASKGMPPREKAFKPRFPTRLPPNGS